MASVLTDDSYGNLDLSFTMFDLNYGARKGHLACCHLLQGVNGTRTCFCVEGRSNHRTEDHRLVLGLIRG